MPERNLIAILRGIKPQDALLVADVLYDAGISKMEVPLNRPQALEAIAIILKKYRKRCLVGGGTVLEVDAVKKLAAIGADFIVSPNLDFKVVATAKEQGMLCVPGVYTPSECLAAIKAGADALKIFPAGVLGATGFKALKTILPPQAKVYAVGGVGLADFAGWFKAGIDGFGLGTLLYQPDKDIAEIKQDAAKIVTCYDLECQKRR